MIALLIFATASQAQTQFALLHSLWNPGTNDQAGAQLGHSVAVDGSYAVVGAPFDDTGGDNSGLVRVLNVAAFGNLDYTLNNPRANSFDNFGWSVAVSGSRIIVGADGAGSPVLGAGAAYVYDLTSPNPTAPVLTLTNPSPAANEFFGNSVAISGTRAVVGAPSAEAGPIRAGSTYVYDLTGGTPSVPVLTLTNPSPAPGDQYGWSVAISGTRVVVGAYLDDTGTIDNGVAYLYDLSSPLPFSPALTFTNPSPTADARFAYSVAISGARVVVGSTRDDTGAVNAGRAFVYDVASPLPAVPILILTNPTPAFDDRFGISVSISGTLAVVGAHRDDTVDVDAGSAYIYDLAGPTPSSPAFTLSNPAPFPPNPTPRAGDLFGISVAVSGTNIVVGADSRDRLASNDGIVYMYRYDPAMPGATITILPGIPGPTDGDQFGTSISVSGTRAAIGAPSDDRFGQDAGTAYVYDFAGSTPEIPVARLASPFPDAGDLFGSAVAISESHVVVGAPSDDIVAMDSGAAYVFALSIPGHPLLMSLTNPYPAQADKFGAAVALSGSIAVIGAPRDRPGGITVGSAYVYNVALEVPFPIRVLTNPTPASFDEYGSAVSISGTRIVVGDPNNDTGAGNDGSAYVYDLASGSPGLPIAVLNNPAPSANDVFGSSVAISGTRVVVGAYLDDAGAANAGAAYVYDLSGLAPTIPVAVLTNPAPADSDRFAISVGISGTRVVVGADQDRVGAIYAGICYIYELSSASVTVPIAILTNRAPFSLDYFGFAVAIDGATIIAGAPSDDSVGPRFSMDSGAAFVFGARPTLSLAPAAPGLASVSWTPRTSSGFVLQSASDLSSGIWSNAPTGAQNPALVSTTNAARYFRLIQP